MSKKEGKGSLEQKKPKKKKIIFGIILILLIIIGIFFFQGKWKEEKILVPKVIGLTSDKAYDKLTNLGLKVEVKETVNEEKEDMFGKVYSQSIYNKKVKKDTKITIKVYVSQEEIKMPDVVDMNKDEAREILMKLGFNVSLNKEETSDYEDDIVFKQDAANPKKIVRGSMIILTYAKKIEESTEDQEESKTTEEKQNNSQKENTNNNDSSWSSWVESFPSGVSNSTHKIETKTQYRSRTKEKTTSQTPLNGWTLVDQTSESTLGEYKTEFFEESKYNSMKNDSNYVISYAAQYKYRIKVTHCEKQENGHWYSIEYNPSSGCPSGYTNHTYTYDAYGSVPVGQTIIGSICPYTNFMPKDYVLSSTPLYQVSYREKITTTTYYYERWTEWGSWQDTKIESNSNSEVQTRTLYRYKEK